MALAPDDLLRVTWRASVYNQEIQFQQHYRVLTTDGATGTLASLFAIASYFAGDVLYGGPSTLSQSWLGMLGSSVSQYRVDCQRLNPTKTIYISRESAAAGTGGAGPKQTNTCSTFSLTSALPGRKQLAKYHIGPLPDSYAVNGALSSAGILALRALAQACVPIQTLTMAIANDCTLQPVIYHRGANANPRFNDVATYRVNYYIRTERRRTINVGR